MNKVNIKKLFELKQTQMLASFGVNDGFEHAPTKGDATEEEWRRWFNNNFPKRYRAEKAFVIDCEGNRSDQMDIVIYDTHFSPTIFENNGEKYIPAESVYAVFEVKQDLSKGQLEYCKNKIKSVKELVRTSAPINTISGYVSGRPAPTIIGGFLTYRSSWVEDNIERNLKSSISEIIKSKNEEIDFICCLSCYACEVKYHATTSLIYNKPIYISNFDIITDKENSPLIFTYFKLLRMLQDMGNVPAIEYSKYGINGIDPNILK